jgi:RNA ligase
MRYEFPTIRTLDDLRPGIEGRDEFIVAEREWGYVANYMVMLIDSFPSADTLEGRLRREARGIKFDRNGDLLARPFQKFFNLGERDETRPELVDFSKPFDILDKLDGSMVHPVLVDDQILWMTKMGLSDTALRAGEFARRNGYDRMARDLLADGITPIYEWMSPRDRIVVRYDTDSMPLTALRRTHSGEYLRWGEMEGTAARYGVPVVGHFRGSFQGIKAFQEHIGALEGEEGYIIRFHDGHMLKLKNLWYLRIHKNKEEIEHEKNVWNLVLEDRVDDVLPYLDDDAPALAEFADQFNRGLRALADRVVSRAQELGAGVESQREYAERVKHEDRRLHGLLFRAHQRGATTGDDMLDGVRQLAANHTQSGPKLEIVRDLIGVQPWKR